MYCKKCGAELEENATICTACGQAVPCKAPVEDTPPPVKKKGSPATILAIVIVAVAVYLLFFRSSAVSDVKDMVFDQYGVETLAEAADSHLSKIKWDSSKIEDDVYAVTLKGFSSDLASRLSVTFEVTYADDYVYANPVSVSLGQETASDAESIVFIMAVIYGNEELATNAVLWSMLS